MSSDIGGACLSCAHCFNGEVCVLFDELIEENCSCWMFRPRGGNVYDY